MRTTRIAGAALLALAVAACGQRAGETDTNTNVSDLNATDPNQAGSGYAPAETDNAVIGSDTKPAAADFAMNAAMSDLYEIQSSELALRQGESAEVKRFAQQMISEHKATTAQLTKIAGEAGLGMTPPTKLDARRQALVDALRGKTGGDFDRLYLSQQKDSHGEALTLHRTYAAAGDNAALKSFASTTAPKVQMHLDMLQRM